MACNCLEKIEETTLEMLTKNCAEKNEKLLELKDWDGDGLQNRTLLLGDGGGERLKTEFVYKTTFTKKDGSESKARKHSASLLFTYCPFCGVKYDYES